MAWRCMVRRSMSCISCRMPKQMRTKAVSAVQVAAYLDKAEEFAESAASELGAGRYIASISLAIHAAINAADAVCGARLGRRAAGQSHDDALLLLQQAGPDGVALEKDLRRLLPLKTRAEYEPGAIAEGVAAKAVERGRRCVSIAHTVASRSERL